MLNIIIQILSWLSFFILLSVLILMFIWAFGLMKTDVPFIPIPEKFFSSVKEALLIKEGGVVYDLGCGDGRVLFYLSDQYPNVNFIGIENNLFPLILAKTRNWWRKKVGKTTIEIIKNDFFNEDLSNATHIFAYLYPNVMDDLLSKFDEELKRGTRLVSMSFHFTAKREISSVDLSKKEIKVKRKLYIYEF